ncbi:MULTISPECIES: peptide chain release factor 3 [unclassified Iodidimonas]|jgi:peptide chain release factor 3|uniref:peptide chain release factor 3 n=1 Tax=unclassified Iodidimonas TaxID=2626145 RepID=UPI002482AAE2|nr:MULTISPECIES: peptide chain release factor 3 [unclassified Iodidimonas]
MTLTEDIGNRRTFAIISHPDAGKTTLTEKLLLFGGAIQLAGEVRARGERRRARSDWMKVEQERGISVASSVMTYDWEGCTFNLLDTPGHEDFSEDTYRVLTAVDSAVMVLDAAKGIETQTRKLFEVCRLRDMPIATFVNKMDREARDPFDLLDEVEQTLALDVSPASWPIGMGRDFKGCYDLINNRLILMQAADKNIRSEGISLSGLDDPRLADYLPEYSLQTLREQVDMVRGLCKPFDLQSYLEGHLTPVFFGSALNSFGVRDLLSGLRDFAPPPRSHKAIERRIEPVEAKFSGFVFKIQANMDPKHRDRMAFVRLVSGRFKRGMKLRHVRSGKTISVHNAQLFLAQDRELAETAVAGDIIGIPNHGGYKIGDSLTEGEDIRFTGIPSFAPELMQRVRPIDPMRAKHLARALEQLAEEGAASVFKPYLGADWIVGVVGSLQFDVLAARIDTEYNIPVRFEPTELYTARWVVGDDPKLLKQFMEANRASLAEDHTGHPVYLARNSWHLNKGQDDYPDLRFLKTKQEVA